MTKRFKSFIVGFMIAMVFIFSGAGYAHSVSDVQDPFHKFFKTDNTVVAPVSADVIVIKDICVFDFVYPDILIKRSVCRITPYTASPGTQDIIIPVAHAPPNLKITFYHLLDIFWFVR